MVVFGGLFVLGLVEARIAGDEQAHAIRSREDEVTQVGIPALGERAFFGLELARGILGPPQPGEFRHGIFHIPSVARPKRLALFVPFLGGDKALNVGDSSRIGDEDPDIAGIKPGPQPLPEQWNDGENE